MVAPKWRQRVRARGTSGFRGGVIRGLGEGDKKGSHYTSGENRSSAITGSVSISVISVSDRIPIF